MHACVSGLKDPHQNSTVCSVWSTRLVPRKPAEADTAIHLDWLWARTFGGVHALCKMCCRDQHSFAWRKYGVVCAKHARVRQHIYIALFLYVDCHKTHAVLMATLKASRHAAQLYLDGTDWFVSRPQLGFINCGWYGLFSVLFGDTTKSGASSFSDSRILRLWHFGVVITSVTCLFVCAFCRV